MATHVFTQAAGSFILSSVAGRAANQHPMAFQIDRHGPSLTLRHAPERAPEGEAEIVGFSVGIVWIVKTVLLRRREHELKDIVFGGHPGGSSGASSAAQ